jgi:hypothetical protein
MSADYYGRIEQARGPQPSESMLAAIARGLHLTLDERDHLFRMAGHSTPPRGLRGEHVSPGVMRILDRLADTPAQVMGPLGETLVQTAPAMALVGDETRFTGPARSIAYRWFTDPATRLVYPEEDHGLQGRFLASNLRGAYTRQGPGSPAAELVDELLAVSGEFADVWKAHEVGLRRSEIKRLRHPEVGVLELHCQTLHDPGQEQVLLVYTARPGSESYDKLQLLSSLGTRQPGS